MSGIGSFLDPGDGVFVNVGGNTGELITDPNTGELKVVIGSNQPVGGGAGGSTQATATGAPAPAIGTQTLVQLLQNAPSWALPVAIFILILFFGAMLFRSK
jgi:hypothetical protein